MRVVVLVARKLSGDRVFQYKGYCGICHKFKWVYTTSEGNMCTACSHREGY